MNIAETAAIVNALNNSGGGGGTPSDGFEYDFIFKVDVSTSYPLYYYVSGDWAKVKEKLDNYEMVVGYAFTINTTDNRVGNFGTFDCAYVISDDCIETRWRWLANPAGYDIVDWFADNSIEPN